MMETIDTFCPECWKNVTADIVKKNEDSVVKGEPVTSYASIAICPNCGEEIGDSRLEGENTQRAFDVYRKRYGLIYPDQIKAIREKYGISQRSLAVLLGIGEASIVRYENGSLPSSSNNQLLLNAKDDSYMKTMLANHGDMIPKRQRDAMASALSGTSSRPSENISEMELNGYRHLEPARLTQCIFHISKGLISSYITRVAKALFIADFMNFERQGESITGLKYAALPMGPVPDGYSNIFQFLAYDGSIELVSDKYGQIVLAKDADVAFSEEELWAIDLAIAYVNSFQNTSELSYDTHSLYLWSHQQCGALIPYECGNEVQALVHSRLEATNLE